MLGSLCASPYAVALPWLTQITVFEEPALHPYYRPCGLKGTNYSLISRYVPLTYLLYRSGNASRIGHSPIFPYLSPKQLLRLSRVSRQVHLKVSAYMNDAYALEPRLGVFFSDPPAFRRMQARTRTLISGDFALRYFNRRSASTILDLHVHDHQRRELGRWLLTEAGYTFVAYNGQSGDFESAILSRKQHNEVSDAPPAAFPSFNFTKGGQDGSLRWVRIHVGTDSPMAMILRDHSSRLLHFHFYHTSLTDFSQRAV